MTAGTAAAPVRGARVRGPGSPVSASVTGASVHMPLLGEDEAYLPAALRDLVPEACPPDDAALVLGRKGLLYKEPATRLALCAVHTALGYAPKERPAGPVQPRTAVVACGNLGNVGTVVDLARTVRAQGVREVSPLNAPNASSNVVASTVALWFRLGGPNLMVCSGSVASADGLDLAIRLLRADRADRVVLVASEPGDKTATALHRGSSTAALRAGAACLVLERPADEPDPGPDLRIGPTGFDPFLAWGDAYGAQGLVGLALGALAARAGRLDGVEVECGDAHDGWRTSAVWAVDDGGPAADRPGPR